MDGDRAELIAEGTGPAAVSGAHLRLQRVSRTFGSIRAVDLVAHHLIRKLMARQGHIRGEVVIVPFANPIGLSQRILALHPGRGDLGVGGNFNRRFADLRPAARVLATGLTGERDRDLEHARRGFRTAIAALPAEDEIAALRKALIGLAIDADYMLDLHTHYEGTVYMYTNAIDRSAAEELGALSGSRAVLLDEGGDPPPGSLSLDQACDLPWRTLAAAGGPHGCFTTTLEYRGQADVADELADQDAEALLQFLIRRGIVSGVPTALPGPLCSMTPVGAVAHLVSPRPGVTVHKRHPGDRVRKGDLVAEVVDPAAPDPTRARTQIIAPCNGVVFGRIISRIARPGLVLVSIATDDVASVPAFSGDPYP